MSAVVSAASPLRHPGALLGALIVGAVLLAAIVAPYVAPHDPFAQDLNLRLVPPEWMEGGSATHPLGTDHLGCRSNSAHGVRRWEPTSLAATISRVCCTGRASR